MNSLAEKLNPPQVEAVKHTEGPLLILAGAGSGKTRTITYRIWYLIEKMNVRPWNILAVTFTNKAAKEMRDRVQLLLHRSDGLNVWVSTIHSACVRILRQHSIKIQDIDYEQDNRARELKLTFFIRTHHREVGAGLTHALAAIPGVLRTSVH